MSLFKARDWWHVQCGSDEEFDNGCLATGCLQQGMQQFVVVGSHSGFLRIFKPTKGDNNGMESTCLEKDLRSPILAVAIGNLVSENRGLAVLHDRKLSVYTLSSAQGQGSTGSAFALKLAYEHSLKRSGYNMCCGPFGKVQGRDFVAVQHLDAAVSVFEQESYSFSRYLPNAVLPGPLVYVPANDSFVTGNSARVVESYRYNSLAVAADAQEDPKGKKVKHDWVFNSGELIMDIRPWPSQSSLLLLNYSSVMCLSESGQLSWMVRFEMPPAALLALEANCVVASSTGQLLVYRQNELLWCGQHSATPVQLALASAGQAEGLIVSLDQTGRCEALYLGTDPSLPIMTPSSAYRDLDIGRLDGQLRSLQGRIRQATNSATLPEVKEAADLQLSFRVPPASEVAAGRAGQPPEVSVVVQGRTRSQIQEVQVTVQPPLPVQASQTRLNFSYVDAANPLEAEVKFSLNPSLACSPARLDARFVAIFTSTTGSPKCVQATVQLPLTMCIRPVPPEKAAACKITLETNRSPTSMDSLFPELRLPDGDASNGLAAAFQFLPASATVTMVASQTAPKYRLQAESLDQMALALKELRRRLRAVHGDSLTFSLAGQLPLPDYFHCIDWHWQARQQLKDVEEQLEQKANQYRAIQKRLLGKFKDKTAAPLQNLDALLESATRQLLGLADAADEAKLAVKVTGLKLCAANALLAEVLQLQGAQEQLDGVLSSQLEDFADCGMEEQLDAALTHVLRTAFSRGGAAKDATFSASKLETPKDTSKLKKHAQMLCEKLARGMSIATAASAVQEPQQQVPATLAPAAPLPVIREPNAEPPDGDYDSLASSLTAGQFLSPREHKKKKKKKHKQHKHRGRGEAEPPEPAGREEVDLRHASALLAPAASADADFYD